MYYFAYGSNMNLEHMRRLCGRNFDVIGPAVLPDFEFGPDGRGYFNVRQKVGQKSFGVLYLLRGAVLSILDEFEGYPDVFNRIEAEVRKNDEKYRAWVYLEAPENFGGKFLNKDYLKRVLAGARENHLPAEWMGLLSSF